MLHPASLPLGEAASKTDFNLSEIFIRNQNIHMLRKQDIYFSLELFPMDLLHCVNTRAHKYFKTHLKNKYQQYIKYNCILYILYWYYTKFRNKLYFMHKQSRMKSKPKFMYGWLRIFLWYNWRYLHINFKLDSDDNNRKLCRDKYLPSWYTYHSSHFQSLC